MQLTLISSFHLLKLTLSPTLVIQVWNVIQYKKNNLFGIEIHILKTLSIFCSVCMTNYRYSIYLNVMIIELYVKMLVLSSVLIKIQWWHREKKMPSTSYNVLSCILIWCLLWLYSFQSSKYSLHINSWSQLNGIFFLHLPLTISVDII